MKETSPAPTMGRFVRLDELDRQKVNFSIDGVAATALEGDTLLTAILTNGVRVRQFEFGPEARAGFCMMAACQDCWVWTESGERLRACDTPVRDGLAIVTKTQEKSWPLRAS